ncbi:hypothetical protein [Rosistilla oblonga]|uniref:hypothetical protein n=1 Tax=Rosistilla oblonga TaxID=2527990 RepID=UPI003A96F26B
MRPQMINAHGKLQASVTAVAVFALLVGSSIATGTASAQSHDGSVQHCSCKLLTGLWAGYRGGKSGGCDACDAGHEPTCGCEQPSCGCEPATCGIEQPACGCEPTCDGGCDGCSGGKSGCGLLSCSSEFLSKFKSKMGKMLRPTPSDCNCCRANTPATKTCGCGKRSHGHSNTMHYRHNEPQPMFPPAAPMIVAPVAPEMHMEGTPHRHYEQQDLPAPKADAVNDPFRDDSVRVRRTPVPAKHASVGHLQPVQHRDEATLRPAVFQQAEAGDRWSAPLHVARLQVK